MDKKNKILYMLHLPPPVHGSSMVGETIKDSQLLNNNFDCIFINLLMSRTVKETGKPNISKMSRFVVIWFKLLFKVISQKPDLCYYALSTTGSAFLKDSMLITLLRIFNIKTIFHLHNKGIAGYKDNLIYNSLYKFIFKKSNVILLSKHLYFDIEKYVAADKVYYCPNGIMDYHHSTSSKIHENKVFKILFLSNLIETKGVFDLIDACEILQNKGLKFQCEFIGGEGDITEEQFNDYVGKKKLSQNVKYSGKRFGMEKEKAYTASDAFVFPTFYPNECFPLVLIEAMQYALPIISTFEGGIPDMVDDENTGFLIQRGNVDLLAEKIEFLMWNPNIRIEMGKKGREKYESLFTMEIFEKRMYSILKNELNKTI